MSKICFEIASNFEKFRLKFSMFYCISFARANFFISNIALIPIQKKTHFPCEHDTVKPVYNSHSNLSIIDKAKVLTTNVSLMKVESIAECSLGAFCNTFDLH